MSDVSWDRGQSLTDLWHPSSRHLLTPLVAVLTGGGHGCHLALLGASKLFLYVDLKVRFRDLCEGDADAPARLIFKDYALGFETDDAATKVALAVDCHTGLHTGEVACEALVVLALIEPTLQTRARYFQRISRVDEVFHVQDRADVQADFGTILVRDAFGLVNEDAYDGATFRPGDLRMD